MKMSLQNCNKMLLLFTLLWLNVYSSTETQYSISVNDISKDEVDQYRKVVENTNGLFSLVKESFSFEVTVFRGITDDELQKVPARITNELTRKLVSRTILAGSAGARYANQTLQSDKGFTTAFIAFQRNSDYTYNVVYCNAEQIRTIDWVKIGGVTVGTGGTALVASVIIPGVGLVIGSVVVVGTIVASTCAAYSIATAQKSYIEMQNVVIGYIGQELSNRKLLELC